MRRLRSFLSLFLCKCLFFYGRFWDSVTGFRQFDYGLLWYGFRFVCPSWQLQNFLNLCCCCCFLFLKKFENFQPLFSQIPYPSHPLSFGISCTCILCYGALYYLTDHWSPVYFFKLLFFSALHCEAVSSSNWHSVLHDLICHLIQWNFHSKCIFHFSEFRRVSFYVFYFCLHFCFYLSLTPWACWVYL